MGRDTSQIGSCLLESLRTDLDKTVWNHYRKLQGFSEYRNGEKGEVDAKTQGSKNSKEALDQAASQNAWPKIEKIFKLSENKFSKSWIRSFLEINRRYPTWKRYLQWYGSPEGNTLSGKIRREILEQGIRSIERAIPDISEKDHDFFAYDLQAKLNLFQDENFERQEFFEQVLKKVQNEKKTIQRLRIARIWKKVGLEI